MTIKQFIFLAGGVLSAYFFSKTISMDLIKWPVVVGTFFLGFAFAFLPLEDRPLDLWVTNFFKAIYLPTMFLWKKSEDIPEMLSVVYTPIPQSTNKIVGTGVDLNTVHEYIQSLPNSDNSPVDEEEKKQINKIYENIKNEFQEYDQTQNLSIMPDADAIDGLTDRQGVSPNTLATLSTINQGAFGIHSPVTGNDTLIPSVGKIKIRPLHTKRNDLADDETKNTLDEGKKTEPAEINKKVLLENYDNDDIKTTDKKTATIVTDEVMEEITREKEEPQTVHFTEKSKIVTNPEPDSLLKAEPLVTKKETQGLQQEIDKLEQNIQNMTENTAKADNKAAEKSLEQLKILQQKLTSALSEKQNLEDQLIKAKNQSVKRKGEEVIVPSETMKIEKKENNTVKFVPAQMSAQIGVVQPSAPNLITGIVKNQNGDILPNILIEIKDKDEKTQRALKTNKLGQFYTATKLDNGVYTIHFEDTREINQFDIIEITLNGNIFPAMEIKAKNPKDVEREKLKAALFGKQE